ncbi:MAG TPA: AMP-binding protein [Anaerolineales bacterium]
MNQILRHSLKPYPEVSLPDVLAQSTGRFPDKIAAVHGSQTVTFGELNVRCNAIALRLVASGIQPGQRVALMGQNSIEYSAAFFGIRRHPGDHEPVRSGGLEGVPCLFASPRPG